MDKDKEKMYDDFDDDEKADPSDYADLNPNDDEDFDEDAFTRTMDN